MRDVEQMLATTFPGPFQLPIWVAADLATTLSPRVLGRVSELQPYNLDINPNQPYELRDTVWRTLSLIRNAINNTRQQLPANSPGLQAADQFFAIYDRFCNAPNHVQGLTDDNAKVLLCRMLWHITRCTRVIESQGFVGRIIVESPYVEGAYR